MYAEPSVVKNLLQGLLTQLDLKMCCKCRKVVVVVFFDVELHLYFRGVVQPSQ